MIAMFKLRGKHIIEHGPGASFWVTGDVDQPKVGTIYTQEKDATIFNGDEVLKIIASFSKRFEFTPVAVTK